MLPAVNRPILSIVGLGYVGLPLAHAFAKSGCTVHGFDINAERIQELKNGRDRTNEIDERDLKNVTINYTTDPACMEDCDVVILAIPTPVDAKNLPDLLPVIKASETVGKHMKKGAIIVYESTVYPGTTEEICGPILEEHSGMKCGTDFTLGYSPERINPGDKEHTIDKILKIVAGQDEKTTDTLVELYGSIVTVGIHRAPNIKTAEMAKAIENAQRDLNIAFVNEIAIFCHKVGIVTTDVLAAAGTKWNFLKFQPGLVGGHCIGVDPYYLVEKAKQMNMETHIITAGRSVNDGMAAFVAKETVTSMGKTGKVLVLGLTFKENIPDTRNSQSFAVIKALQKEGCDVCAHDPHVQSDAYSKYGVREGSLSDGNFDAVLLLVKHQEYLDLGTQACIDATKEGGIIYDLKSVLNKSLIVQSGRKYLVL